MSFMYQKPPGLDAALARDAEMEKKVGTRQMGARCTPACLDQEPSGMHTGCNVKHVSIHYIIRSDFA